MLYAFEINHCTFVYDYECQSEKESVRLVDFKDPHNLFPNITEKEKVSLCILLILEKLGFKSLSLALHCIESDDEIWAYLEYHIIDDVITLFCNNDFN